MINPEHKPQWRPKTDLGKRYNVGIFEPPYRPKTREDAVTYVASLAVPEVTDYDGYPEVQADIAATLASEYYPELFKEAVTLTVVEPRSVA